MPYTSTEIVVMMGAAGAAINGLILSWKYGTKIDQTLISSKVIEGHVNSKETRLNEQIIALQNENRILRDTITEKNKTKELLAQAVAQSAHSTVIVPPIIAPPIIHPTITAPPVAGTVEATLARIDDNTAGIERNTAANAEPKSNKSTILVIDDDDASLTLTGNQLETAGYIVRLVKSAVDAIANLANEIPNLIVLDIRLPGRDGLALVHQIRTTGLRIPIIAYSAYDTESEALLAGCNEFVLKDGKFEEVLAEIKRWLNIANSVQSSKSV